MSEEASKKKTSKLFPIIVLLALLVLGIAMFLSLPEGDQIAELENEVVETNEEVGDNAENNSALEGNQVSVSDITKANEVGNFDLNAAKRERILGNSDASVKISEHSSFSCGHCGKFHSNVFKDFKANWIDTGKAYLVFSDFPLNAPALHASMVGRCIKDDEQYFAYVEDVFAKQRDWAFQADHTAPLKAIAANHGIDNATFDACVNNQELQLAILGKVRAAQQQFNVTSTPSFVVNNVVTIAGGSNYEEFNSILIDAIKQSKNPESETPQE